MARQSSGLLLDSELIMILVHYFTGHQLQFVISQVRASTKKKSGLRWTTRDKALALSLLHSCPKTYRLLRKTFFLPSVRTLKKVMSNINIYPGFSECILSALRLKVQKLPPKAKLVSIAMDEMAIKEGLAYDARRDSVEGFSDASLANHALVFLVRGLIHRWKQPFGYFLSSGPITGGTMKELLFDAVEHLHSIGLTVCVVISDQGSNNINLFQTKLKVNVEKPYFFCGDHKIFVMYDPPHLIKNIRNNLKKHGFVVDGKDIAWKYIQEFHDKDSSKPTRLAPRLTSRHLNLPPFSTLRVKLATQVLSHSVASGMKVMAEWDIIEKDAVPTADFLESFDQLFNAFNSSTLSSPSLMKHAFSNSSGHKQFVIDKLQWLKKIKSKGI